MIKTIEITIDTDDIPSEITIKKIRPDGHDEYKYHMKYYTQFYQVL